MPPAAKISVLALLSSLALATGIPAARHAFQPAAADARAAQSDACQKGDVRACFVFLSQFYALDVLDAYGSASDDFRRDLDRAQPTARATAKKAYEIALRACESGRSEGCGAAGLILAWGPYAESLDLKGDRTLGLQLLSRACRGKHQASCGILQGKVAAQADAFERRRGQKDTDLMRESEATRDQALRLLEEGCGVSAWACNYVGLLYERGSSQGAFKRNPSAAEAWYSKGAALARPACDAGSAVDCSALAWLHAGVADEAPFTGLGEDRDLAASLYRRACQLKIDDGGEACDAAERLRR